MNSAILTAAILGMAPVKGQSMYPTLDTGQQVIIRDTTAGLNRGDIVWAKRWGIVKRLAAVEGDTVEFNNKPYIIPKGRVWLLGDNPARSKDSRKFGSLPRSGITGVIILPTKPQHHTQSEEELP